MSIRATEAWYGRQRALTSIIRDLWNIHIRIQSLCKPRHSQAGYNQLITVGKYLNIFACDILIFFQRQGFCLKSVLMMKISFLNLGMLWMN